MTEVDVALGQPLGKLDTVVPVASALRSSIPLQAGKGELSAHAEVKNVLTAYRAKDVEERHGGVEKLSRAAQRADAKGSQCPKIAMVQSHKLRVSTCRA